MDLHNLPEEQITVCERLLRRIKTSRNDHSKSHGDSKKRDTKDHSIDFKAFVSGKKSTNQPPFQDGVHRIWQSEQFKKKSIDDFLKDRQTNEIVFLISQ